MHTEDAKLINYSVVPYISTPIKLGECTDLESRAGSGF